MNIKNNLGMYAEEIVNRTRNFLMNKNEIYFEKREVPIKIIKKTNDNTIVGKLLAKSYVDYFGYNKDKHFEFEVKQTQEDYFDVNLIKEHQLAYLFKLYENNIPSFLIVYFSKFNKFYLIKTSWLKQYLENKNKKKIPYDVIMQNNNELEIVYPGVLDMSCIYNI
ncbi:MAG: Holliday junction resolvase RecU [Mycoplasmataceae bacterium]|jgi:recombination protein U|nr:Holliday junction resolvase RecU [Mycoplasmataceae bacterium]